MNYKSALIAFLLISLIGCQPSSPQRPSGQSSTQTSFPSNLLEAIETFNETSAGNAIFMGADLGSFNYILQMTVEENKLTPIGMISIKDKDSSQIAESIQFAVEQTKQAKQTPNMLITSLGVRIDPRGLKNHTLTVDPEGHIMVDEHFVSDGQDLVKLNWICSTNTLRVVAWEDGTIYFVDTPLAVRPDRKGMQIVCTPVQFKDQMCYSLERPTLPEDWESQAAANMQDWPLK